jgi:hypothetical protein
MKAPQLYFLSLNLLWVYAPPVCRAAGDDGSGIFSISPDAHGSQFFAFRPLFPTITFHYGLQFNTSNTEWVGFWIDYPSARTDPNANVITTLSILYSNSTGSPGGDNNGCDGCFGKTCSDNLKDLLKRNMIHAVMV